MPYDTVLYEPGTVARVILDRPEKRNAQSWTLLREMESAFNEAVAAPDVRVIVLPGAGSSFSGGHDLDSAEQVEERRATLTLDGMGFTQSVRAVSPDFIRQQSDQSFRTQVEGAVRYRRDDAP